MPLKATAFASLVLAALALASRLGDVLLTGLVRGQKGGPA
jgi:hypothetical protein